MAQGKKLEQVEVNRKYIDFEDPLIPKSADMHADYRSRLYWGGRTKSGRVYYDTPTDNFSLPIK